MKKAQWIILFSMLGIYAVLNLGLFLLLPPTHLFFGASTFTAAWIFAFPVNAVLLLSLALISHRGDKNDFVILPAYYYIIVLFQAVSLATNIKFMVVPLEELFGLTVVVNAVILLIFAVVLAVTYFAIGYIRRNQAYTARKVAAIRFLKADVDAAILTAASPEVKAALAGLSDEVRFSDPMSHESLAASEAVIAASVSEIAVLAADASADTAAVLQKIATVSNLIKIRNEKCKILK